jgi:DNA repair protein RadA/Sms
MAKVRTVHRCTECGWSSPRWAGRCGGCEAWNTLVEEVEGPRTISAVVLGTGDGPMLIADAGATGDVARASGIGEVDRVLGGGLVPGSVTLVGGEPGIGKSTLLLQVSARWARTHGSVLYITGEESANQVHQRAKRLDAMADRLYLIAETSLPRIAGAIDQVKPQLVVVDSIQTVHDPEVGSAPGSVTQVREGAHALTKLAKDTGVAIVLVGHVTKDGGLAGPRVLEHVVDTVLAFEGDRHHDLRSLRAQKHRFGPTSELGLFKMTGEGLVDLPDPSGMFLADRRKGVPGSVVASIIDGHRPLLAEVQALVSPTSANFPRRSAQGFDAGRLALLLAVLEKRCNVSTVQADVFASVAGGVKINEPGGDLAVALALASAAAETPIPPDVVVIGEVGLVGEIRHVAQIERRLAEAARVGFAAAVVPASSAMKVRGIEVIPADDLPRVLDALGVRVGRRRSS